MKQTDCTKSVASSSSTTKVPSTAAGVATVATDLTSTVVGSPRSSVGSPRSIVTGTDEVDEFTKLTAMGFRFACKDRLYARFIDHLNLRGYMSLAEFEETWCLVEDIDWEYQPGRPNPVVYPTRFWEAFWNVMWMQYNNSGRKFWSLITADFRAGYLELPRNYSKLTLQKEKSSLWNPGSDK